MSLTLPMLQILLSLVDEAKISGAVGGQVLEQLIGPVI